MNRTWRPCENFRFSIEFLCKCISNLRVALAGFFSSCVGWDKILIQVHIWWKQWWSALLHSLTWAIHGAQIFIDICGFVCHFCGIQNNDDLQRIKLWLSLESDTDCPSNLLPCAGWMRQSTRHALTNTLISQVPDQFQSTIYALVLHQMVRKLFLIALVVMLFWVAGEFCCPRLPDWPPCLFSCCMALCDASWWAH